MDIQELQELMVQLQTGDTPQRRVASRKLRNAAEASSIAALIGAFNDPDNWVRRNVLDALGNIGSKEALDFLESKGVRLVHLAGNPGQRMVAEVFQNRMLKMSFQGGLAGAVMESLVGIGLAYFPYSTCDQAWYYIVLSLRCPPLGAAEWYWASMVVGFFGGIMASSISSVFVGEIAKSAFPRAKDPYHSVARTVLIVGVIFGATGAFLASLFFFLLGFV